VRGVAGWAAGLGSRGTARVVEIDPTTGLRWVGETSEPLHAVSASCLRALQITHVPLDALYAVRRALRDAEGSAGGAGERLSRAPHGVWTAIDPAPQLLLSGPVGNRSLAMAQAVLPQVAPLLVSGGVPRF
jgi:hypothetical protein